MAYLLVLEVQRSIAHPDKPGCQSPEGVSIAKEALEWVHRDRKQGYILSFNRLYDVTPSTDPHLVYGVCVVCVFAEAPFELQHYFCAVRHDQCPDCPKPDGLDDPIVMDTTKLFFQRFNAESTLRNYLSLQTITKDSSKCPDPHVLESHQPQGFSGECLVCPPPVETLSRRQLMPCAS
ncbi:unnamed protein product [Arctogadus glacialis]